MLRNTFFAVVAVLAAAASTQAAIMLSADAGVDSPNMPGFKLFTITATSTVEGETIAGVDLMGDPAVTDPATARGFFGPMSNLGPTPVSTVFQDNNGIFGALFPGKVPANDSQFLFATTGEGAVNSPAGFASEGPSHLRALFSRDTGFGQSFPLAQLVVDTAATATVNYRGVFAVNQGGSIVDLPEISGQLNLGGGPVGVAPNIMEIVLNDRELSAGVIMQQLDDGPADPDATWSGLTLNSGSPVNPASLSGAGVFSWDPAGSLAGKKGNGVLYRWTATATNGTGADTDFAISIRLIPEPATFSLLGLAMIGLVGISRRRSM